MSGEDSPEIFRDNKQCEQDVNVSLIETERNEEDDQQHDEDDQQHDEDYQQHDEEPAYTPNVPVYNPYDVLRFCTVCESEEIDYIGKADEKECCDGGACTGDVFYLYSCKICQRFICSECVELGVNMKVERNHKL